MTDRELMQMALDGLNDSEASDARYEAIKALRDRLAQPDAETFTSKHIADALDAYRKAQIKREWVGLTDTEVIEISKATSVYGSDNHYEVLEFVAAIEAKLKEKNA
jgi:hypothetical protein